MRTSPLPIAGEPARRPLRRSEYDRLVEEGCFLEERVELVEGDLRQMSPQKPAHADLVYQVQKLLAERLGPRCQVRVQSPFAASELSEPEPDIAVVPVDDYSGAHPARAFLIVEVADTSLRHDLDVKALVYAEAGVAEYWVLDLVTRRLVVHAAPGAAGYSRRTSLETGDSVRPIEFPDVTIAVSDLLPTRR